MRELWNRLRDRMRRDQLDAELSEELRFHQRLLERDERSDDREAAARRRFGNVTRTRETARERWSLGWVDAFEHDVRQALRGLRKSPGFATAVILTLALGVGANAAMFGIIDRLMFRPFPYLVDPGSVNRVYLRYHDRNRTFTIDGGIEYTRYLDLQRGTTSFSQYAAFYGDAIAVGSGDEAQEREVAPVSASFFSFFRVRPALGRFFVPSEDAIPRGAAVAVLGYGFWQSHFGGRDVLGQTLQVGNLLATIVGVAPKGFAGISDSLPPAVYVPITSYAATAAIDSATYYNTYHWGWVNIMVRRKPGITVAQASADLSQAYRQSWSAERAGDPTIAPIDVANPSAIASALKTGAGPEPRPQAQSAVWVGGVAVIVLLIACANVTNLFLVRAMRRRRETAMRIALGVTRRRLLAQYVTESLVLSLLAGVAGMLVAQWGGAAIRGFFGYDSASLMLLSDWRTLALTGMVAVVIGVVTGAVPALLAEGGELAATLKTGARAGMHGRSRLSGALLVAQAALSMLLLVGAGLFVRSMAHVRGMRMGYDVDPILLAVSHSRGAQLSDSGAVAFSHEFLATAQSLPGVSHAAWVASVPFYSTSSTRLYVAGIDSVQRLGRFTYEATSPDYFATMGTRITRGRGFSTDDRAGSPRVAVVSASMAHVLWPERDPIGQCMRIGADTMPCTTVVGIAEDAVQNSLTDAARFRYYLPIAQFHSSSGFALLLRMRDDPLAQAESVRRALQRIMPGQYYVTTEPLSQLIDAERAPWEFGAAMFAALGVLALVVAGIGLYALIAYSVAQRMHELGVRIALGAQGRDVMRLILSQGVAFALSGVAVGGALALLAARWVRPVLFQESPRDPLVFGAVTALLLAVAVVACLSPAWRASRADPNTVLRTD